MLGTDIIATLGPATYSNEIVAKLKASGVTYIRTNMSHSSLDELQHFISIAKHIGIPFIIDTQGSQVRSGPVLDGKITLIKNNLIKIHKKEIVADTLNLSLFPEYIVEQLDVGDILHVDFDSVILRVVDCSSDSFVMAEVMEGGTLGSNKGIKIDRHTTKEIVIDTLTEKDKKAIEIGIQNGIKDIAISFARSKSCIELVREHAKEPIRVISKIECLDALHNLDEIIEASDAILIDRGDLSKEVPIERIPFIQKLILRKARLMGKNSFVATNLLESMLVNKKPTRAEINDIINTLLDGATGLVLAAETAIGKYPLQCVNVMEGAIKEFNIQKVDKNRIQDFSTYGFVNPHGGKLISRVYNEDKSIKYDNQIILTEEQSCDAEQIAIGTYSPIKGFMCKEEVTSVLENFKLLSGEVWPLPITLNISQDKWNELKVGDIVSILNINDNLHGSIKIQEKFTYDLDLFCNKLYGTNSKQHPGVKQVFEGGKYFVGGEIKLFKRRKTEFDKYSLTPQQVRKIFHEKNWNRVAAFHTRNIIHRGHEYLQRSVLDSTSCDGLFIHPVIGKKKKGDFLPKYIISSYEKMIMNYYDEKNVLFATFGTYSRYAGPREALFTALCRQNYGCSHFILGRDHAGVKNYYGETESQKIFSRFPEIEIKPLCFNTVGFDTEIKDYVYVVEKNQKIKNISASSVRQYIKQNQIPPSWLVREDLVIDIIEENRKNKGVFF